MVKKLAEKFERMARERAEWQKQQQEFQQILLALGMGQQLPNGQGQQQVN
jgi:hypothetical protein